MYRRPEGLHYDRSDAAWRLSPDHQM